jgi:AcrR family transcriptional regulator
MKNIEDNGINQDIPADEIPLAEKRKEQIIKATCQCIVEKGYNTCTMQDIAAKTGLSKGMIHYYFATKENLLISVMENLVNQWDKVIADKLNGIKDPHQAIWGLLDACAEIAQDGVSYNMLVKFWAEMGQKKAFEEVNANFYSHYRKMIKEIIEEGINQGQFNAINAYLLATIIISIIDGLSLQWLFDKDAFSLSEAKKMAGDLILAFLQREKGSGQSK